MMVKILAYCYNYLMFIYFEKVCQVEPFPFCFSHPLRSRFAYNTFNSFDIKYFGIFTNSLL